MPGAWRDTGHKAVCHAAIAQVVTETANKLAQQLSTQTKIMALSSPKQCKGWTVFKNWKGFGVCKGTVTKAVKIKDPNTQKVVQGRKGVHEGSRRSTVECKVHSSADNFGNQLSTEGNVTADSRSFQGGNAHDQVPLRESSSGDMFQ